MLAAENNSNKTRSYSWFASGLLALSILNFLNMIYMWTNIHYYRFLMLGSNIMYTILTSMMLLCGLFAFSKRNTTDYKDIYVMMTGSLLIMGLTCGMVLSDSFIDGGGFYVEGFFGGVISVILLWGVVLYYLKKYADFLQG